MIIGFGWGGWVTAGTAETMTHEAVLSSQAAICVAQFMKDPNHQKNLSELKELNSWDRAKFIEKGKVKSGDLLVLVGSGVGYNYAGVALKMP